jgi:hypothetical protein
MGLTEDRLLPATAGAASEKANGSQGLSGNCASSKSARLCQKGPMSYSSMSLFVWSLSSTAAMMLMTPQPRI